MKQLSLVVIFVSAIAFHSFANGEKNTVPATLRSAIVYRSGAELQHTARATLSQGNNELVIEGISSRVDENSIRVGNDGNITVMSVGFSVDHLKPVQRSPQVKKLDDSLTAVNKALASIQVSIKTNNELLELLKANKEIRGTQTGLSVAELTKMMDYYRNKTLELQRENTLLKEKESELLDDISALTKQIKEEEQKNTKTVGRLQLQLFCPVAGSYNFTVSYVTPLASWSPAYDLRVENITQPVKLSYKAKLVQSSGFDWKNVKLTLATSIPNQNSNAPSLKTWFLSYQYPAAALNEHASFLQGRVAGLSASSIRSVKKAELEEVVVTGYSGYSNGSGSTTPMNIDPLYIVNGTPVSKAEFKKIESRAIKDIKVLKDAEGAAIYGSRANAGAVVVTLKDELTDYVAVNDNELNVTFEIDLPYDVPNNGKEQNVPLKEYTVPASYKYFTAPGSDKDAYLLGAVADWEKLNLLPGEANIIFEGTYIGRSAIDPASTLDTLNFTMGRDKRVVVKREKLKDFSSVKFLGSNKKQVFTYEITVRNNKKEPIQIELKDQYPLSTNKDIEVELLESGNAVNDGEKGILTWKTGIAPGESKKFRFSYSVKYPKDKMINI